MRGDRDQVGSSVTLLVSAAKWQSWPAPCTGISAYLAFWVMERYPLPAILPASEPGMASSCWSLLSSLSHLLITIPWILHVTTKAEGTWEHHLRRTGLVPFCFHCVSWSCILSEVTIQGTSWGSQPPRRIPQEAWQEVSHSPPDVLPFPGLSTKAPQVQDLGLERRVQDTAGSHVCLPPLPSLSDLSGSEQPALPQLLHHGGVE